jgi:hypothetical protein
MNGWIDGWMNGWMDKWMRGDLLWELPQCVYRDQEVPFMPSSRWRTKEANCMIQSNAKGLKTWSFGV